MYACSSCGKLLQEIEAAIYIRQKDHGIHYVGRPGAQEYLFLCQECTEKTVSMEAEE